MKLTAKLLGYLPRSFDRDPEAFTGITIQNATALTWQVEDGVFYTTVGGVPDLELDLSTLTLQTLVNAINAGVGYTAALGTIGEGATGALVLIEASGDAGTAVSKVLGYRSLIYPFFEGVARELTLARAAIAQMLTQLNPADAIGEWLDLWLARVLGGTRETGEIDADLQDRIIRETLRIRCNNRALEQAVEDVTGQVVDVIEIPWALPGGVVHTYGGPGWNATQTTNNGGARLAPGFTVDAGVVAMFGLPTLPDGRPAWGDPSYGVPMQGVFAVVFDAAATCEQRAAVLAVIEKMRAGGTYWLTFKEPGAGSPELLNTNAALELTNDPAWLIGPTIPTYDLWTCP